MAEGNGGATEGRTGGPSPEAALNGTGGAERTGSGGPSGQESGGFNRSAALGYAQALGAFGIWGFFPVYIAEMAALSFGEILAHRVLWSALTAALIIGWRGRLKPLVASFTSARLFIFTACAAVLLVFNWSVFIHANLGGAVLEISLGYYMMPLVMSLLGVVFSRERLTGLEGAALAFSAAGVTILAVAEGRLPWISLALALSFPAYGMVRKRLAPRPMEGMCGEMLLALPLALAWLAALHWQGEGVFGGAGHHRDSLFLVGLGLVTIAPLALFNMATRRLRYVAIGFLSYLGPSLQFVLAITFFNEPFTAARLATFLCIWAALGLFSLQVVRGLREHAPRPGPR